MKRRQEVAEYIAKYPSTNRNKIALALGIDQVQLKKGEKAGFYKLPKPLKPNNNMLCSIKLTTQRWDAD